MQILRSNRNYRFLWSAQVVSVAGDWLRDMGILFWVYEVTDGSYLYRSIVLVAELLPPVLLSLLAGSYIDRFDRRKVLVGCNLALGVCSALHILLVMLHQVVISIGVLLVASCLSQFLFIARSAVVRSSVSKEEGPAAVAITSSTYNVYQVIGPLLGMGLYEVVGPRLAFSLDAITFLTAALLTMQVRLAPVTAPQLAGSPAQNAWRSIQEGLAYSWKHRVLQALLGAQLLAWIARGVRLTLLIFIVTAGLNLPKEAVTSIQSIQGVFMLASSLVLATFVKKFKRQDIISNWGFLLFGGGLLLMGLAPNLPVMLGAAAISAVGMSLSGIGTGAIVMRTVDEAYAGRFFGLLNNVTSVGMLLASSLAGPAAEMIGVRPMFSLAAVILFAAAALGFWVVTPALTRLHAAETPAPATA